MPLIVFGSKICFFQLVSWKFVGTNRVSLVLKLLLLLPAVI